MTTGEEMKKKLLEAMQDTLKDAEEEERNEARAIREANLRDYSGPNHVPLPRVRRRHVSHIDTQRRGRVVHHDSRSRVTREPSNPFKIQNDERAEAIRRKNAELELAVQLAHATPYEGDFGAEVRNSRGYVMIELVTVPCPSCAAKVGQPCDVGSQITGIHGKRRTAFVKFAKTEEGRKQYHKIRRLIEASGNPRPEVNE